VNPDIVDAFHREYYNTGIPFSTYWRGVKVVKAPTDMWMYHQILWEQRPQVLVETGTAWGGSALFFADMFDLIGEGQVITVDIGRMGKVDHPRIEYVSGDSVALAGHVGDMVGERSCMVVLDSNHTTAHVAAELDAYGPLVTSGQYLVVEDTNCGHLVAPEFKDNGPTEALIPWLVKHPEFVVDRQAERFGLTMNPGGWLRRS
jgi:cephalosporin hydroxylase